MKTTLCMFDLFHGDPLNAPTYASDVALFRMAKAAGFTCLIHKLTEGARFVDPVTIGRLGAAVKGGLMVGGYHFMNTDPVMAQVANFMHVVGQARMAVAPAPFVIALDNEPENPTRVTDSAAEAFVEAVLIATGRRMTVYGNRYNFHSVDSVGSMAACPLWLAEYGTRPIPPPGWVNWAWHQRTDGTAGPYAGRVPGIGAVDQSEFAGSADEAIAWWVANAV